MTDREQFESWASGQGLNVSEKSSQGLYIYGSTADAWGGWQAARAASPKAPEGMAIVPVDCITTIARDVEYSPHTSRHTPFLKVSFAYDDYDSRDKVHAMLATTKETKK